jgi:hypothetical protein
MNKNGVAVLLIVVAAFVTASVIGYQNGLSSTKDGTPEQTEQNSAIPYTLTTDEEFGNLAVPSNSMATTLVLGTVVKMGLTLE